MRALREVPVWLPGKDEEAIEAEREAKRLFYERDLLDIHGKVPVRGARICTQKTSRAAATTEEEAAPEDRATSSVRHEVVSD